MDYPSSSSTDPSAWSGGVVLGRSTLEEVHKDIRIMSLPSWIGRVPHDLGSASHGSLSADQWRTACTVNLVTTLGRLWGSKPADSIERRMLENFMDLVAATKLANMRTITPTRIADYDFYMLRYLQRAVILYPNVSLRPYHHLSLHYSRFLKNFGPTHSWRCFPFERYNYLLQQVNTNSKFGRW